MSTSPDNRLVLLTSQWLAGHVGDGDLVAELERVAPGELTPTQAEAVEELRDAFASDIPRGDLERIARETLEALALGL
jgi:hypothetical protein